MDLAHFIQPFPLGLIAYRAVFGRIEQSKNRVKLILFSLTFSL